MLDSDEEDEGEGGVAGEPTTVGGVGGEPLGGTPIGEDEELSNDNENFSHVSYHLSVYCVQCIVHVPTTPPPQGFPLSVREENS